MIDCESNDAASLLDGSWTGRFEDEDPDHDEVGAV